MEVAANTTLTQSNGDTTWSASFSLIVKRDSEAMSLAAFDEIITALDDLLGRIEGRRLNVVLSAGSTPRRLYQLFAANPGLASILSGVSLFQMDEYVDAPRQSATLASQLLRELVLPLDIKEWHPLEINHTNGAVDWSTAISRQENELRRRGGIDLILHGIGANGHLGFNEPGSDPSTTGRVVELSASTRRSIPRPAPHRGATLGLSTLLRARRTILIASGCQKSAAIDAAVQGPISSSCPASWLRIGPHSTFVVDDHAAELLRNPLASSQS